MDTLLSTFSKAAKVWNELIRPGHKTDYLFTMSFLFDICHSHCGETSAHNKPVETEIPIDL